MDKLSSKLLDRINGLARKGLKTEEPSTADILVSLVKITENVRLIKRIEKIPVDDDDDVDAGAANDVRQRRTSERVPAAAKAG